MHIITRTAPSWQHSTWQDELKNLIRDPDALIDELALGEEYRDAARLAAADFPLRATASYVSRIVKGNPTDPLLLQILPLGLELQKRPGDLDDPLEEARFSPVPGLIHKYQSRVLLVATSHCAIHCRYCFRRNFPYDDHQIGRADWLNALDYVRQSPLVNEVILSGGDPLSLGDKQLQWLIEAIADIPQVIRLRIHTRYPIVLPSRFTESLMALITQARLKVVMVVHCNHPQEIDDSVRHCFAELRRHGLTVLNQSVILKGINDNSQILATLSEQLFSEGVIPYYLHMLDPAKGVGHFDVALTRAQAVYAELLGLLPGYLVPKLVREIPSRASKTPVAPL